MEDLFVAMQWPTGNHSALLALVAHVSMYVCPRKPVSEACFDNILGTGFGMHLDGGDAYRAKRPPRWTLLAVPTKIFRVRFWVACWGTRTPTKLRILSNSRAVLIFHRSLQARLAKKQRKVSIKASAKKRHAGSHGRNIV